MDEIKLIEKVKTLIKDKDISKWEDFKGYHEARDLLLDNGFINNDNLILKKAYFDMFPTNEFLETELKTSLKDISSNNEEIRIKASKYLQKAPANVVNLEDKLWLKEPRTIEILCRVLESETNNNIIENIILCLGSLADRYGYNDISIFRLITSKFDLANDKIKLIIAQSGGKYPVNDKWKYIYQGLDCKPKKRAVLILTIHLRNQHQEIPKELKVKFKEKLLEEFYNKKNKNEEVKTSLINTAIVLMEKEDLIELKNIRDNYPILSSTEKAITKKLQELES